MNNKRWISLLGCTFCLLAACTDNQEPAQVKTESPPPVITPEPSKPKCSLTMGWDPWEPYQYLTPDDEVRGLEIDLVSAMAKTAGCDLKFVQKNWMTLLNDIRRGGIDFLGGASKTETRETFAYFSDYYRQESFVLYVRAGEAEKFQGQDLATMMDGDFKLGVTDNYIYGEMVTDLQDKESLNEKFVAVPTTEANYFNLIEGRIDGFLDDPFVAAYTMKRKGIQDQIEAHPLRIHSGDVALMFSKKSVTPEIVESFNKALQTIKDNGEYKRILDKYRF